MKTLQVIINIDSGQSDLELINKVSSLLEKTALNNSEFKLDIREVKILHTHSYASDVSTDVRYPYP